MLIFNVNMVQIYVTFNKKILFCYFVFVFRTNCWWYGVYILQVSVCNCVILSPLVACLAFINTTSTAFNLLCCSWYNERLVFVSGYMVLSTANICPGFQNMVSPYMTTYNIYTIRENKLMFQLMLK